MFFKGKVRDFKMLQDQNLKRKALSIFEDSEW